MFENQLSQLFNDIANNVNRIIPVTWNDLYFNIELKEGDGEVLFYFNTKENPEKYIFSHDIPVIYDIPFSEYMDTFNQLMSISRNILKVLEDNNQPKWYAMVLIVKSRKQLKVEFDYTDWFASPFTSNQRLSFFKYKYLGEEPENNDLLQLFKEMEEYQNKS
ncbi:putative antitoxin YezG [Streptococcus oralis]|uniref:Putative antitoxin YezG n=1 Tax=Streptococcus oralis TaxID=1303 RepID=A0A3R9I2D2_STROR|nr:immunity protein YezG family protein [Streptococcus oralis]RSI67371.1 putative antitoxin YezG [Streptococcus oralis]